MQIAGKSMTEVSGINYSVYDTHQKNEEVSYLDKKKSRDGWQLAFFEDKLEDVYNLFLALSSL